jgi:S-adenosylmethionine hydrolase
MTDDLSVSFLSDFGLDDEFVGVVHGVIARIAPGVRIIDVTHGVPRGDVRAGALSLLRSVQYLPDGVVLAVVDPGVGTGRRAIAAATPRGYFVGPDNGLLGPAVAMVGGATRIVALEAPEFRLAAGSTFDGRDVFGPAAAVLASGEAELGDLGPDVPLGSVTPLLLPLVDAEPGSLRAEAWWVDAFGNVETNVAPEDLAGLGVGTGDLVTVRVGVSEYEVPYVAAYGDVEPGQPLLHVDSAGLVAIAVREGRADEHFVVTAGTAVVLTTSR